MVIQAPSQATNPNIPRDVIDKAMAEDPARAQAEWEARFRPDIEDFVQREIVLEAVPPGVLVNPFSNKGYLGFVDPAGGSGRDSMTLAISHKENDKLILDAIREHRPPFSPEQVVSEFVQLLNQYRCTRVVGDHYAGEFAREPFKKLGITYEISDKNKSEIYQAFLPLLNSGRVRLLDNQRLINQLCSLERRTGRTGKDIYCEPPNSNDDVCNAVAGSIVLANTVNVWKPGDSLGVAWL